VAGCILISFTRPETVTHPSTNRAGRRVTSLIETNALPLSQTAVGIRVFKTNLTYFCDIVGQLNTGSHLNEVSEDMQMLWFQVEPELSQVISEGLVTGYDIDSAGQSKSRIFPSSRMFV